MYDKSSDRIGKYSYQGDRETGSPEIIGEVEKPEDWDTPKWVIGKQYIYQSNEVLCQEILELANDFTKNRKVNNGFHFVFIVLTGKRAGQLVALDKNGRGISGGKIVGEIK